MFQILKQRGYLIECVPVEISGENNLIRKVFKLTFWTQNGLLTIWSNKDLSSDKITPQSIELGAKPRDFEIVLTDASGRNKIQFHRFL